MAAAEVAGVIVVRAEESRTRMRDVDGNGGNAGFDVLGSDRGRDGFVDLELDDQAKDRGNLWDSGRVVSGETTWIEYGGKNLVSGQRVYWKVRVWGEAGNPSPWSAPATWSMDLLQPSDWQGKWIGQGRPDGHAEGTPLSHSRGSESRSR